MSIKNIHIEDFNWWFWVINFIFIVISIAGWEPGYYIVMEISLLNLLNSLLKEKNMVSAPVQFRLLFFLISLTGFWVEGRYYTFLILLVFTFLITFTGNCIVNVLKRIPWNYQHREKSNGL